MMAAAPVALVTIVATAAWGDFSVNKLMTAGPVTKRIVLPTADIRETQSSEWSKVSSNAGYYGIFLPPGKSALVSARFTAASSCSEEGGAGENSSCEARIAIGDFPGLPVSLVYPFDTTEHATAKKWEMENHTVEAHSCVKNGSTQYAKAVPVQVEWRVSPAGNDGVKPTFVLANSSLTIDLADNCTAIDKP
jgi:hypothetical protein